MLNAALGACDENDSNFIKLKLTHQKWAGLLWGRWEHSGVLMSRGCTQGLLGSTVFLQKSWLLMHDEVDAAHTTKLNDNTEISFCGQILQ